MGEGGGEEPVEIALSSSAEVAARLVRCPGILIGAGSVEQHGPIGLVGTDMLCAHEVAREAARLTGSLVLPPLAYGPAQFNMKFPGTLSIRAATLAALALDLFVSLAHQGIRVIYVVNGHGGNVAPLESALHDFHDQFQNRAVEAPVIRLRAWWEFAQVDAIRIEAFGEWEGVHATPSEISLTEHLHRVIDHEPARNPPRRLDKAERSLAARDRHGPAELHHRAFPDGRVGSHSTLAGPEIGARLFAAASRAVAQDFSGIVTKIQQGDIHDRLDPHDHG